MGAVPQADALWSETPWQKGCVRVRMGTQTFTMEGGKAGA